MYNSVAEIFELVVEENTRVDKRIADGEFPEVGNLLDFTVLLAEEVGEVAEIAKIQAGRKPRVDYLLGNHIYASLEMIQIMSICCRQLLRQP